MTRTDYWHGGPLPHHLPNRPQPHPTAPERFSLSALQRESDIRYWPQFPEVIAVCRVVWPRVTELYAAGLNPRD